MIYEIGQTIRSWERQMAMTKNNIDYGTNGVAGGSIDARDGAGGLGEIDERKTRARQRISFLIGALFQDR